MVESVTLFLNITTDQNAISFLKDSNDDDAYRFSRF
jgi:hypothetical protein